MYAWFISENDVLLSQYSSLSSTFTLLPLYMHCVHTYMYMYTYNVYIHVYTYTVCMFMYNGVES